MAEENNNLNNLDSKINDRGFFERILKEFKETLAERNLRLDERFGGQKEAITKAEQRLDAMLAGFPEEYVRKVEIERLRETLTLTATTLAEKVADTEKALTSASDKASERVDERIKMLESFKAEQAAVNVAVQNLATKLEEFREEDRLDKGTRQEGIGMSAGLLVGGLGVLGAVITLVLIVSNVIGG